MSLASRDALMGASLRRDRGIKEQKLGAQRRFGAFQEEEVGIFEGNLQEASQLYEQQLKEQRLVTDRHREAAVDLTAAETRKRELVAMVAKIGALKAHNIQQDQAREKELDFRDKLKQKREAFQRRCKTIEAAQGMEEKELVKTQSRAARNLKLIHSLEMRDLGESDKRLKMREYELQYQQMKMRQQKEAEQLREMQLIKVRHLSEQMDNELACAVEIEDLTAEQKLLEQRTEADQVLEIAREASKLDRQQAQLKALQFMEDQKGVKNQLIHTQKRQRKVLERTQRASAKIRERTLVEETTGMLAEVGLAASGAAENMSVVGGSERDTDAQSSITGASEMDSSDLGLGDMAGEDGMDQEEQNAQGSAEHDRQRKQRETNSAAAELLEALEKGLDRLKRLQGHHKEVLEALRIQHKDQRNQKLREHKRKSAQLHKDQEEEIRAVRTEQANDMEELFEMIKKFQELHTSNETATIEGPNNGTSATNASMKITENIMPARFADGMRSGSTLDPVTYRDAVVVRTAADGLKLMSPRNVMTLLQRLNAVFDQVIAQSDGVCKVENVADSYTLCAGLHGENQEHDDLRIKEDVQKGIQCALKLQDAANGLDVKGLGLPNDILAVKVGVYLGPVKAGMVGARTPQFRVMGETVNQAARLCQMSEPGTIFVSKNLKARADSKFTFEEKLADAFLLR
ncbi:hypothetical protein DFS34DRAFT_595463 [Phlyctochytrium arcticum]|nr:hypothetical protein DFS34DRAFT_595463 [Phlyctochytrium arcticum]